MSGSPCGQTIVSEEVGQSISMQARMQIYGTMCGFRSCPHEVVELISLQLRRINMWILVLPRRSLRVDVYGRGLRLAWACFGAMLTVDCHAQGMKEHAVSRSGARASASWSGQASEQASPCSVAQQETNFAARLRSFSRPVCLFLCLLVPSWA